MMAHQEKYYLHNTKTYCKNRLINAIKKSATMKFVMFHGSTVT